VYKIILFQNIYYATQSVPDFENPDNVPTLIVLDDMMDSAYSTKVSELFTKGSHNGNISLVLITQNFSPRPIVTCYFVK
jgi:hypothetical protein